MASADDWRIDRLFIAIPELSFNVRWTQEMLEAGVISQAQYDKIVNARRAAKRADKAMDALSRGSLVERLVAVAPELLSVEMVDVLRGSGLISTTQGHALRVAIRTLGTAGRGGLPADRQQIFGRLARVLGVSASFENIDLLSSMGLISGPEAERWRGMLRSGRNVAESLAKARRAKSIMDALMVLGEFSVSPQLIRDMTNAGIISPRLGRSYLAAVQLGVRQWKVFGGSRGADGLRARLALVLTGSMNRELLDFMRATGVIDNAQWANMQIMEILARRVNQRMLEDLTARRYRVRPGEPPIRSFARASRGSDADLLRLLAEAARESAKEAETLAALGKKGANIRSAQYRLAAKGLHEAMRNMWDGVGYLSIWGEREVAEAAAEGWDLLNSKALKDLPPEIRRSLLWQAKGGVDSYISRQENTLRLSRLVYKNMDLYQGNVDRRISIALLRGQSAAEISRDILKYISPNTPGGASYAAMRLARTEINNSFHFSTIRYTREQPWVQSYRWHKSSSHKHTDQCDAYANDDHDGLGAGIFRKANVPGKPHPQCLCYITAEVMDPNQFIMAYRAGRFDSYMKQVAAGAAADYGDSSDLSGYVRTGVGSVFGR